jgi:predicted secreted acid phosphatase
MNYLQHVKKISKESKEILYKLNLKNIKNPAIIFDIDDTLICATNNNYGLFIGESIEPIIDLYNTAKELGIRPIIITARGGVDFVVKETMDLLKKSKIKGFYSIYFRPIYADDPYFYKTSARKHAADSGFNILMSVGDQEWDMGNFGGIPVKLPSLM